MPVVLIPVLYGAVAFVVAFLYQLAIKRPLLRAFHFAAIFGLFVFMLISISAFMFGVPDLRPEVVDA